MKRMLLALLGLTLAVSTAAAQDVSLGEYARQQRAKKKTSSTSKVYTDEDLPKSTTLAESRGAAAAEPAAATAESGEKPAAAGEVSPEERAKAEAEWKTKVADQKKAITQAERELDVLQREYKLRAAVYYADAGTQLRDSEKWTKEEVKFRDDLAAKQKEVQEAKDKLEQLREEIRRAGFSSSVGE